MLGFRWMKSKDVSTGLESKTEYSQQWPYVGMALNTQVSMTSGLVIKRNTNTPACNIPQTTAACAVALGNRYFPYVAKSLQESWDLNGALFPAITTNTQYGPWGDPTSITVLNGSDGSSKQILNEYQPADTNKWILGRLIKSTVTSSKP